MLLIGQAFFSTLNQLEKPELWAWIPNIALVMSMFIQFASGDFKSYMMSYEGELYIWPFAIRTYALKHNMDIEGVYEIEPKVWDYSVSLLPSRLQTQIKAKASKDKFKYREWHKLYAEDYGWYPCMIRRQHEIKTIGGNAYDISRMSEVERKRHCVGGFIPHSDDSES